MEIELSRIVFFNLAWLFPDFYPYTGYHNAAARGGGVEAWENAGYPLA